MENIHVGGPPEEVHATHENAIVGPVPGVVDDDWSAFSFSARRQQHGAVSALRALIHVVLKSGASDKSGRYCIENFAIDMYCALLRKRQDKCAKLCWRSVFLDYRNILRPRFLVYDSLACVGDESRDVLLTSAKVAITVALLGTNTLGDALRWDMARLKCVQPDNGYDCGVFVMAFMDLIWGFRWDGQTVPDKDYRQHGLLTVL
ncbi:hypothetical protein Cgig2_032401 [Carnegiea gigantea]|uniref:Ubiquitin-like protease family profile domain-containing protein n=1 Tax=Carnegiea gigantea TaxID=171969 RepID=A0A9Q1GMC9_9CARY|nr:hypothetical protein Cgig2_032401 [Carnegiea gigantea]